ncbi:MAG: ribonucleotide reductase N-terminal alpha domain-containing protein [Nanoarchaeota archaeon]|nr:ribonucleotide reductase N-terminal alpha domain-containing protein [Nanoarchaeota archaeon]
MQQKISQIKKRDGSTVGFDQSKITAAVFKAAQSVGGKDRKQAQMLSDKVVAELNELGGIPSVEQIQDTVEKVLIEQGHAATAKAYILYRQQRAEIRKEKQLVLEKEEIDDVDKHFDVNALRVLKARYLRRDATGKLIETPKQLFTRVAVHAALPDLFYAAGVFDINGKQPVNETEDFKPAVHEDQYSIGKYKLNRYHLEALKRMYNRFNRNKQMKVSWSKFFDMIKRGELNSYEKNIDEFYNLMTYKLFMPNTPAIANFGNPLGMGSACFVLDVPDSIDGIMETLKNTAIVFKAGGGMGYNFSKLRPEGDFVSSTGGVASGPISFMRLFDTMTEVIKQGGIRRGANMGILNSNHPDIEKFITAKDGNKSLRNFNISVLIMPDFWDYYEKNEPYPLVNPKDGTVVKTVNPRVLFDKIVYQAWESAEPGVIFFDKVNDYNPFYEHLGPIVTTNPCVAGDTLISTENGLERIDSMKTKSLIVDVRTGIQSNNLLMLQKGCKKVEAMQVIKTGIKDTYKVITKSGYGLVATEDHRVLTENGWKEVCKLTEEDSVFLQSGQGSFSNNFKLPFEVGNTIIGDNGRTYSTNLPKEWSKELGLVLGWLTGDGWLSEKHNSMGFVFAPEDNEVKDIIKPILENYFNRKIEERKYQNGCVQLRSASKHVIDFFKKLGVTENKGMPSSLFTATEDAVIGFLQGLFAADGTIGLSSESRNYIRLNSSNIQLLKEVQLLLLNLGIRSSIYNRSTKPKEFKYTNIKGELVIYRTSGINYELNISKENVPRFIKKVGFLHRKLKDKSIKLNDFKFYEEHFLDSVKSVEYAGKMEVYDITEPSTHSFIANGLVVHNCGEVLLYPNEPCNLGSINVWAFAKQDEEGNTFVEWNALRDVVRSCTRFLDNVIDVNNFPLQAIEEMSLATRKIGLGVMGVGDLLFELKLPYNTEEGRKFMEQLMEFIAYWSKVESIELAKKRGNLPYYDKSFYKQGKLPFRGADLREEWHFDWDKMGEDIKRHGIRNGYTTIIAPTGSISMIAGCSSGMEPVYSVIYEKNVKVGSFYYVDPAAEKVLREEGLYNDKLMEDINEHKGSIQRIKYVPERIRNALVTAMDITPEDHIRALASFQKWVDSSISKTNNFPADATLEHMKESYILAYKLGCKDVTVFRDSSIKDQVLVAPKAKEKKEEEKIEVDIKPEMKKIIKESESGLVFANGNGSEAKPMTKVTIKNCPECGTKVELKEGCLHCPGCGWGLCM